MSYDLRRFFYYIETNTQNALANYIKNKLGYKILYILDSQSMKNLLFCIICHAMSGQVKIRHKLGGMGLVHCFIKASKLLV